MTSVNLKRLNLFHWNANGITTYSHQRQLENLLVSKDVHIASINETYFKEKHKPFFENYYTYRNDRISSRGGGVALLVHKSLNHNILPISKTSYIENLSVQICINRTKVTVTTAYSPKHTRYFRNDIKALTPPDKDFIILGDFNAKHYSWNCPYSNTSGRALNNLQRSSNFFVYHPNNYTLYPHQRNRRPSTVDIVLSNISIPFRLKTLEYEIPSDHLPIMCSIECSSIHTNETNYFCYKNTNWRIFQNIIDRSIVISTERYNSKQSVDREIDSFTHLVTSARNISTPLTSVTKDSSLPRDVVRLIGQRKKFKRKLQRSTNSQQSLFYSQCVTFLSYSIDKRISAERNSKWSNLLHHLKPGDKKFWKISRSLRCKGKHNLPHLMNHNHKVVSDTEKAELLANTFAKAHTLTLDYRHAVDSKVNSLVTNLSAHCPNIDEATFITVPEISQILSTLKSSKAPGFDDISNIVLKKLPEKAIKLLTCIFNSCIHLNYFPKLFKKAKVIPIHKPNKPVNNPNSYRPISLLSNIGKIFEKLIYHRLSDFTSSSNVISEKQFGFKKEHNTIHQVGRIKNKIIINKGLKKSTGLILLDIEKAFDTVWHNGLLYKLTTANIPKYICNIIADFLHNRTFAVSVNKSTSSFKNIPAGLPQGSILSPILYSIYTSDFKPPKETDIAYYADDTALISSSKLTSALLKKMERSLVSCNRYFRKWKIKINQQKTQSIIFPWNKSPKRVPLRQLFFDNNSIHVQDDVKYLGVTLDKKLTFRKHILTSCDKAVKSFRALWPLLNRRSLLNHKNKNLLYKCVIRPILSFASPIWYRAAKSHLKRLQIVQNKCLKMINCKHWRYSTATLHEETGYELFKDFIKRLNENYFNKITDSSYEILRECNEIL